MVNHGLFQFRYPAYKPIKPFQSAVTLYNFLGSDIQEILLLFPIRKKKTTFIV
jgi:hypothetical protein